MPTSSRPSPTREEFLQVFGGVYENSRWVAEAVWDAGHASGDRDELIHAMQAAVNDAGREQQLDLLRAHPDLAGRLAKQGELTEASKSEQDSAGLSQCTPEEYDEFQRLNNEYREKFGFPFILAVRGYDRLGILAEFRRRVQSSKPAEFDEALRQVHRIARLRLEHLFSAE